MISRPSLKNPTSELANHRQGQNFGPLGDDHTWFICCKGKHKGKQSLLLQDLLETHFHTMQVEQMAQ